MLRGTLGCVLVGLALAWHFAGMTRIHATLALQADTWFPVPWSVLASGAGVLVAHRWGGTARSDARLAVVSCIALAVAWGGGPVPSSQVARLTHAVIALPAWMVGAGAIGIGLGVAIRAGTHAPALLIGAFAAGVGLASASAGPLIDLVGAPGVASLGLAAAATCLAVAAGHRHQGGWPIFAVVIGILIAAGTSTFAATLGSRVGDPEFVPVQKSLYASVTSSGDGEQMMRSAWGASGRIDLTRDPAGGHWLYLDGAPYGFVGRGGRIRQDGSLLPFVLPSPVQGRYRRVLVVGLGGATEVALALESGATTVTVADPHPGAAGFATRALAASGAPNALVSPGVRVVGEDARAFLASTTESYDLIVVTLAAFGASAEPGRPAGSNVHTRQAIAAYLDHLEPEGMIAVRVRDEHELWRAINTAFQVITATGATTPLDAVRHLLAVNDDSVGLEDEVTLPTVFVRKRAFTEAEVNQLAETLDGKPFKPLLVPNETANVVVPYLVSDGGESFLESTVPFNAAPARDDQPYFIEPSKRIPWLAVVTLVSLGAVAWGATWAASRRPDDFGELEEQGQDGGYPDLDRRSDATDPVPFRYVAVAMAGGGGAGMLGLVSLWQLPLLVGRPDLALAAGGLALAGGTVLASLAIHRSRRTSIRAVAGWGALAAAALPFVTREALAIASPALHGLDLGQRMTVGALVLVPIGFGLGASVPAVLRLLEASGRRGWEPLVLGAALVSGAVGMALANVASRLAGDAATAVIGAGACLACFLGFGLRWMDEGKPGPDGKEGRGLSPADLMFRAGTGDVP